MIFAFDFWGTLTDTDAEHIGDRENVRELARKFFAAGHEVHIVSAISPGLPLDSDGAYAQLLGVLKVPFTKVWRVDHKPELKLEVLKQIKAHAFWDDVKANVDLARKNQILTCHVGVDDVDWLYYPTEQGGHAWTPEQ